MQQLLTQWLREGHPQPAMRPLAAIELIGVEKAFGANRVLRGIDLTVRRGETMSVMGPSGTGKSVLLKLIVGLLRPDAGRILVDGEDVTQFESEQEWNRVRKKVGFLFQGGALYDSMSVLDNVAFALRNHTNLSDGRIRERSLDCLRMVGLEAVADRMPSDLSGGMQKRVGLARTVAMDPRIILYDEPTTGLDPVRSRSISLLIRHLQHELKVTSMVVTHDMGCVFTVSDHIAMLYEGRIVETGTVEEIRSTSNLVVQQFIAGKVEGPIA